MRNKRGLPVNGWLIIDKESGLSSAQVVARVRRLTNAAKVGHAGTLDPLATGVLPIALGEATKTMAFAMDGSKSYRFTIQFGAERSTDDAEGEVVQSSAARPSASDIEALLPAYRGLIQQVPPIYSAIKVEGERAYALARQGDAPVLAAREVRIDRFDLAEQPDDHSKPLESADFIVDCGKGTYVRSLARDLGRALGCFGSVAALRRTRVGPFHEAEAFSLAKLAEVWDNPAASKHLLPVETALADIPALALTGPQADRLRQGQPVRVLDFAALGSTEEPVGGRIILVRNAGKPVALAEWVGDEVHPVRVFNL